MSTTARRWPIVARLGVAQTLAWASSYYLPALLAAPMAHDLGVATTTVFAAFSVAMLLAAAVGPAAGRAIDRLGGRPVLIGSNLVFAAGLGALAVAQGPWTLFAAWLLIGAAMGSGLYEAGFATLVRLWGHGARGGITGITLIAGFASTVGWPLSAWLEAEFGWRVACAAWALLHLGLGLPLNASLPKAAPLPSASSATASAEDTTDTGRTAPVHTSDAPDFATPPPLAHPLRAGLLLSFVFAATWFVSTAMASHLPAVLQLAGAGAAAAVAVGSLIGPAQVAGRLMEAGWL
ncbi:MAG: MFS transporter, partial [Rhodoferax sp.]|nr:MFS transporter [Rhodoferax sp.]